MNCTTATKPCTRTRAWNKTRRSQANKWVQQTFCGIYSTPRVFDRLFFVLSSSNPCDASLPAWQLACAGRAGSNLHQPPADPLNGGNGATTWWRNRRRTKKETDRTAHTPSKCSSQPSRHCPRHTTHPQGEDTWTRQTVLPMHARGAPGTPGTRPRRVGANRPPHLQIGEKQLQQGDAILQRVETHTTEPRQEMPATKQHPLTTLWVEYYRTQARNDCTNATHAYNALKRIL